MALTYAAEHEVIALQHVVLQYCIDAQQHTDTSSRTVHGWLQRAHLYMSLNSAAQAGRAPVSDSMRTRHASTSLYAASSPAEMDASDAGRSTRATSCMHTFEIQ